MKRIVLSLCFLLLLLGAVVPAGATPVSYVGGVMTFTFWENGRNALWGSDIDVVNVWEVMQFVDKGKNKMRFQSVFTSLDVGPDYDGIPGVPMEDGPFMGFSASFDFNLTLDNNGVNWSGDGNLTMYDPIGNIVNPEQSNPSAGGDRVRAGWNGQFGDLGQYTLEQTNSNYFQHWEVTNIETYELSGTYIIDTGDFLYYQMDPATGDFHWLNDTNFLDGVDNRVLMDDGSGNPLPTNEIVFFVPQGTLAVPEPSSLILLGTGVVGLLGFRRKMRK